MKLRTVAFIFAVAGTSAALYQGHMIIFLVFAMLALLVLTIPEERR